MMTETPPPILRPATSSTWVAGRLLSKGPSQGPGTGSASGPSGGIPARVSRCGVLRCDEQPVQQCGGSHFAFSGGTMHDSSIPTSKLITATLWAWVVLLFVVAWSTWLLTNSSVWMMLAFTGCASSAVAATSQIRCYSLRLCAMMRALHNIDDGAAIRPVR